ALPTCWARFVGRGVVGWRARGGGAAKKVSGEVAPAGNAADHGHDDVVDQRVDDLAEGHADDDADGKIDNVAPHGELLEFLEHHLLLGLSGRRAATPAKQKPPAARRRVRAGFRWPACNPLRI